MTHFLFCEEAAPVFRSTKWIFTYLLGCKAIKSSFFLSSSSFILTFVRNVNHPSTGQGSILGENGFHPDRLSCTVLLGPAVCKLGDRASASQASFILSSTKLFCPSSSAHGSLYPRRIDVQLSFVIPMSPLSVKCFNSSSIDSSLLPSAKSYNAQSLCHMSYCIPVHADLAGHNPDSRPLEQDLFVDFMGIAYASSAVEGGCG